MPMGARGAAMADTVGLKFKGVHGLWDDLRARLKKAPASRVTASEKDAGAGHDGGAVL
jgi:hypothetical protein